MVNACEAGAKRAAISEFEFQPLNNIAWTEDFVFLKQSKTFAFRLAAVKALTRRNYIAVVPRDTVPLFNFPYST